MKSRVYVVAPTPGDFKSSFIKAHLDHLPAEVVPVHGVLPSVGGKPALAQTVPARLARKLSRMVHHRPWEYEITQGYLKVFRRERSVVLAEYGPTGARVMDACAIAGIPLVVHFHGYDASVRSLLNEYQERYSQMFKRAAAIVVVSTAMQAKLIAVGAPPEKVVVNPCGVDCDRFHSGAPGRVSPTVVATGYFVEKKAPHLTILAFAKSYRSNPAARLRMIGNGPLLSPCKDLVSALGLDDVVTLLGEQPHDVVQTEMRQARCFVQHSIEAQDGNSEGLPCAILEAGATGLPVVSTRHAGIVDAVVEGATGYLVSERDIEAMGDRLSRLLADAELAGRMGATARRHIEAQFSLQSTIGRLWSVIETAMQNHEIPI